MRIFQHIDELNDADGIGNDIKGFHDLFTDNSIDSFTITRVNRSNSHKNVSTISEKNSFSHSDIHILHYGGAGYPLNFFENLKGKKYLRFHNITPVSFFKKFLPEQVYFSFQQQEIKSRVELALLSKITRTAIHDSSFNEEVYKELTGKENNSVVLPIIRKYIGGDLTSSDSFTLSYVGRLVPSKKIESLFFIVYFLKRIDRRFKLQLIGKRNPIFHLYYKYLEKIIMELNIRDSIIQLDSLSDEELKTALKNSFLYISMSEHEGYGIPLLEAMGLNIPVLYLSCPGIKSVLGETGIEIKKKDFPEIAELIAWLKNNNKTCRKITRKQTEKIESINHYPYYESLRKILEIG